MESKTKRQHRKVECDICKKFMRFSRLKGHKRTKHKKHKSAEEIDDVRARCLQNQKLYLEKIELGKQVASLVESGEVMYESLEKIHKNSFDTYRKYLKVEGHS